MAKELTIYPVSDVTLNHSKYPSNSENGYTLIYDVTSDDDTSYIYQSLTTNSATKSSTFKCDDTSVTNKIYLRSISYNVRARYTNSNTNSVTANLTPSVSVNGKTTKNGTQTNVDSSYSNITGSFSSVTGVNTIYNSISDANIVLGISTTGNYSGQSSGKSSPSASIYITQANLTISYDDVFDCSVYSVAGTGIKTVKVDKNEVVDGETATFTATLNNKVEFDGWYSDAECKNKVSSSTTYTATITENTTLYARGVVLYSVSVVKDDHTTVTTSVTEAKFGSDVTVTATLLDGYSFDGWYSNENRTTLVSRDNPYTFRLEGDTTLYALSILSEIMMVKVDGSWVEQTTLAGLFDTEKKYKIIKV